MKKKIFTSLILVLFAWTMSVNAQSTKRSDKLHFETDTSANSIIIYNDLSSGDTVLYIKLKKINVPIKLIENSSKEIVSRYLNSGNDSFVTDDKLLKASLVKNKHYMFIIPMTVSKNKKSGFYFSEKSMSFKPFSKTEVNITDKNDNTFSKFDFFITLFLLSLMVFVMHLIFSSVTLTIFFGSLIFKHLIMSTIGVLAFNLMVSTLRTSFFFSMVNLTYLVVPGCVALIITYFVVKPFYKKSKII